MSSDLFKYINNIMSKNTYDSDIPDYHPFIVNKALSMHVDTAWYANDMNMCAHLNNRMQYDYLYHSLKASKRYTKWVKASQKGLQDLDLVREYFGYNVQKAKQALSLLTKNDIEEIKRKMIKGGT